MKLRLSALLLAGSAMVCIAGTAQGCPMPEPGDYDEAIGADALMILADVVSMEFFSNEDANCSKAVYRVQETFVGPQYDVVESQACFVREADEVKIDDLAVESSEELSEARRNSGFYPGASVLVSLTRQTKPGKLLPSIQSQSEYRPALTSCWGFPHVNIGILTEEQRSDFIADIREAVDERTAVQAKELLDDTLISDSNTAGDQ